MKSHEITEFQYKADSISRERVSSCSSSSSDPPKAWVVHLQLAYKAPSDLSCKLVSNNIWQGVSLHPLWPNKPVKSAEEMNQGLISHPRDSRLQDSRYITEQGQHNSAHFWAPNGAGVSPTGRADAGLLSSLYQRGPAHSGKPANQETATGPLSFCLASSSATYTTHTRMSKDTAVQACSPYLAFQCGRYRLSVCRTVTPEA